MGGKAGKPSKDNLHFSWSDYYDGDDDFAVENEADYALLKKACEEAPETVQYVSLVLPENPHSSILEEFGPRMKTLNKLSNISILGLDSTKLPGSIEKSFLILSVRFDALTNIKLSYLTFSENHSSLFFKSLDFLSRLSTLTLHNLKGEESFFARLNQSLGNPNLFKLLASLDIQLENDVSFSQKGVFAFSSILKRGIADEINLTIQKQELYPAAKKLIYQGAAGCSNSKDRKMGVFLWYEEISGEITREPPDFMVNFPNAFIEIL